MTIDTPSIAHNRTLPVLEGAFVASLMLLLNVTVFRDNPGLVTWSPHPTAIITLAMLLRYDFASGAIAAATSAASYVAGILMLSPAGSYTDLLTAPYVGNLVVLVPLVLLVGLLMRRRTHEHRALIGSNASLQAANRKLDHAVNELRSTNEELGKRVVDADVTLLSLYQSAKRLNARTAVGIYEGVLTVMQELVSATAVSIWEKRGAQLCCVATRGETPTPRPMLELPFESLQPHLMSGRDVLLAAGIPELHGKIGMPVMLATLRHGEQGPPVAYLAIDDLPFARCNKVTVRNLALIAQWASMSLGLAQVSNTPPPIPWSAQRTAEAGAEANAVTSETRLKGSFPPTAAGQHQSAGKQLQ